MNLDDFKAKLFSRLGLHTAETIERFLNPHYERDIHDPFLLKDMDKAVERIQRAIKEEESIWIYGDYDADGIPATVLLFELFKKIGIEANVYIPHRNLEGFGLNVGASEELASKGADLVITVDCGITDVEAARCLKEKGVDLIITDHHMPHEVLPDAFAVINPKRVDCAYPFKELSGSGVAWKLASALLSRGEYDVPKDWEKVLLGWAAIGTVCDMVPLSDENRAIAKFGLLVLRKLRAPGWKALLEKARINQATLTEDDLAFSVGPRLNAASRMGDARDAFKLLTAPTLIEAKRYADTLESLNSKRKGAVAAITRAAKAHIKNESKDDLPVIVCGDPAWKPSLLGLAAGSLADEFGKPVFLWGREEAIEIKGSCRSGGKKNVVELMKNLPEGLLSHYGGHVHAGGFSLPNESVFDLENELIKASANVPDLEVNDEVNAFEISPSDVGREIVDLLSLLAPFGIGNPRPLMRVSGTLERFERFGGTGDHAKFLLRDESGSARVIHFRAPLGNATGGNVCIDGVIEESFFGGRSEIRVRLTKCSDDFYEAW